MKKLPLILIVLCGVLTPVFATLLFYVAPPQAVVARGEILLPPRHAPAQWELDGGKWTLLFAGEACGGACKKRLCQMRQLRLMLPGAYQRLQRAWLRPSFAPETPDMTASADCGEARAAAFAKSAKQINITEGVLHIRGDLALLPPPAEKLSSEDYLYLIDPAGIFVLRFAPDLDIYAVRKDLARLLKISKGVKGRKGVKEGRREGE